MAPENGGAPLAGPTLTKARQPSSKARQEALLFRAFARGRDRHPSCVGPTVPSVTHQSLLYLFQNRPDFLGELLEERLRCPRSGPAVIKDSDLSQISVSELRVDLVVEEPGRLLFLEVQLQPDTKKHWSWPAYLAVARQKYQKPVSLVVLAGNVRTERWARQRLELGHGFSLRPLVLGPATLPLRSLLDRTLERLSLGTILHSSRHGGKRLLQAALPWLRLDAPGERTYLDLTAYHLHRAGLLPPGALMKAPFPPRMQFVTDILRMQEVAKEEGLAEGMGRGRAEGEALALLTV
ncbi:MAG TPA: hypothetical protein PKW90_21245, partial [Myxococcota bacterium]|nr:hypothetical protein [Myxococcota bacterium]